MKNYFVLALLLLIGGTLQAQFTKGTQLLTGNFNINASNRETINFTDTSKNNGFGAGIGIGRQWVHKENRIRGFQIGYDYTIYTQNLQGGGENKQTYNAFNVGYVSQYLLPFGKRFFGTVTLLSQFAFNKRNDRNTSNSNVGTNGEIYTLSFGLQPGLAYQINKRWIADVTLGNLIAANLQHSRLRSNNSNNNYKDRSTNFNLNSIFAGNSTFLGIGFRYILR